ncbi:unnamed protein product [Durusdinium trenchii]|uniref:Uncharacterized protein n=1 Tax=Durusdinium trenchii TaxID=1381693 RepID=A0ABP0IV13_9DINO
MQPVALQTPGLFVALGNTFLWEVASQISQLSCSGKRLGDTCYDGQFAVAGQRGVCASVEVDGASQLICLACEGYTSGLSEVGIALGRLGTWGVFAVGVTVGSVATSGLLAVAWQFRRRFEMPFEEMLRDEDGSGSRRRRSGRVQRATDKAAGPSVTSVRLQPGSIRTEADPRRRKPPDRARSLPKQVISVAHDSVTRETRAMSGWRRRFEDRRSIEPTRLGRTTVNKWSEIESQLDRDLKDDSLLTWVPPTSVASAERRGPDFTAPSPSRCPPRPAK